MSGSATFTIVMSSSSMKTPVQTAASVHHLPPAICAFWVDAVHVVPLMSLEF